MKMLATDKRDKDPTVRGLDASSLRLLLIGQVAATLFAVGVVSIIAPASLDGEAFLKANRFPCLWVAFGAMILLQICLYKKGRHLRRSGKRLISNISFAALSNLTDPVTRLFDMRYLEYLLPQITSRGNRIGLPISFLHLRFSNPESTRSTSAGIATPEIIAVLSELLLSNFRGSDTILRLPGWYFLVILPDTSVQQAQCALRRLDLRLDEWNLQAQYGSEMLFRHCFSIWDPGDDVNQLMKNLRLTIDAFESYTDSLATPQSGCVFPKGAHNMEA